MSKLERIVIICRRIEKTRARINDDFEAFLSDPDIMDSIILKLIQIGESVIKLSERFVGSYDEIDWYKIRGFRNLAVHDYDKLKLEGVWRIVTEDVPRLESFCFKVGSSMSNTFEKNIELTGRNGKRINPLDVMTLF